MPIPGNFITCIRGGPDLLNLHDIHVPFREGCDIRSDRANRFEWKANFRCTDSVHKCSLSEPLGAT